MTENNLWKKVHSSVNSCDIEQGIIDIKIVTDQLKEMTQCIRKNPETYKFKTYPNEQKLKLYTLEENITEILRFWTYFEGDRCEKHLMSAFKAFYNSLVEFLLILKDTEIEWDIMNALYQGPLYFTNYGRELAVVYGSYIEWTRNPEKITRYVDPKLNQPVFLLKKEVYGKEYGIDMKFFDVSQGEEEILCPLTCFSVEPFYSVKINQQSKGENYAN